VCLCYTCVYNVTTLPTMVCLVRASWLCCTSCWPSCPRGSVCVSLKWSTAAAPGPPGFCQTTSRESSVWPVTRMPSIPDASVVTETQTSWEILTLKRRQISKCEVGSRLESRDTVCVLFYSDFEVTLFVVRLAIYLFIIHLLGVLRTTVGLLNWNTLVNSNKSRN